MNKVIQEAENRAEEIYNHASSIQPKSIRLVSFTGRDYLHGIDIDLSELKQNVHEITCEGFYLDVHETENVLYLCQWEHPGPKPPINSIELEQNISPDIKDLDGE